MTALYNKITEDMDSAADAAAVATAILAGVSYPVAETELPRSLPGLDPRH
jgi:hypothetical protein